MSHALIAEGPDEARADARWRKRSFVKLAVEIDVAALLADLSAIPPDAWTTSHWNIHCSSNMLLLRGGKSGTEHDFSCEDVADHEILKSLPYIARLLADDGPFGPVRYAFLFRMKPMGVARVHRDDDPAWKEPFRVHIPVITNDDAVLLSEGRAKHFAVGEVWTFDNQARHSVSNGDAVRTHLIIDVLRNPKFDRLLEAGRFDEGAPAPQLWQRTMAPEAAAPMLVARSEPLSVRDKMDLGLNPGGFAARITSRNMIARASFAPIREGDIVFSVNGVEDCAVARTAIDYIQLRHKPGEAVDLGVIADGRRQTRRLRLYGNPVSQPLRKAIWKLRSPARKTY